MNQKSLIFERIFVAFLGAIFILFNIWAFAETGLAGPSEILSVPLAALSEVIPSHRWATVVTTDLVLGWFLMAFVMAYFERNWKTAAIWIVFLFWIGNLIAVIYFVAKLPTIKAHLSAS
jgi:hypothetical protein